ncbi:hypothetical protein FB451DRAFT_1555215 [Mycena latifolia]|nr:hypothetical protein FB451DRAFT_1555215 [Mycena latifolia]
MSTTSVTRRLSARRGSTSAPDPFAKNAHLNRESSSILTIVRVTSPPLVSSPSTPISTLERPPSPRARAHRRIGSNPTTPLPSPGSPDPAPPGRMSFAFSSFGAPHQQPNQAFSKPRLSPEQLLEVAKQATNPLRHRDPHSPTVTPATFTPLPPDVVRAAVLPAIREALCPSRADVLEKHTAARERRAALNTADWTFTDLSHWLTETTRDEASDRFWVQTARRCILLHSELIWERLKGALGVPPELDVEYTEAQYNDVFEDDSESDGVVEDGGKVHWEDWDAVLDSPIFDTRRSAGSSPSASRHASAIPPAMSTSTSNSSSTPTIMTQVPTPRDDDGAHPPPLSLPASLSGDATGLGDIGEEEEDEEEDGAGAAKAVEAETEVEVEPPQLHGLRISTPGTPMSSPGLIRSAATGAPMRSPSFSAREPAFARSSSSGSLHRSGSFGSVRSLSSSTSEGPYDPVADRAPGNPLFPSNFARLALGPTLAANNPALRSPTLPPQSKFGFGSGMRRSSSTRSVDRGNRFRRSWGGGDEYAVTLASGSSAGGSVRDA